MTIGAGLKSVLPPDHRQALYDAVTILIDEFCEDIAALLSSPEPIRRRRRWPGWRRGVAPHRPRRSGGRVRFRDLSMATYLPPQYVPRYTPVFAKQFLACLMTVAWKLRSPEYHVLACVGEELALAAIVRMAESLLELQGVEADFGVFEDIAFEDMDYQFLFEAQHDGIDESSLGRLFGMASLRFPDWMKAFWPENPTHPYCEDSSDAWEASLMDEPIGDDGDKFLDR